MTYKAFDLSGKVVLVTGGNGGIGLGIARAVGVAGANVCIWGRNGDKNQDALENLAQAGIKSTAMICDVSDEAAVDTGFSGILEEFGRVDACFANAGVTGSRAVPFTEMTANEWRRMLKINLDGAFLTLRTAARHMVERAENGDPGGRLVGTASLAALSGPARNEHYAATKGGVISMMRGLAVEMARHGVTANSILPGWIETDMTRNRVSQHKFQDKVLRRIPMRRWGATR